MDGMGRRYSCYSYMLLLGYAKVPSREAVSGSTFVRRRGHRGDLGRLCSHGAIHGERPGGRGWTAIAITHTLDRWHPNGELSALVTSCHYKYVHDVQ